MPIFFLKSITIRPLNAEELAELQGFRKEGEANKANNGGSDSKLNNKVLKEYPPLRARSSQKGTSQRYLPKTACEPAS